MRTDRIGSGGSGGKQALLCAPAGGGGPWGLRSGADVWKVVYYIRKINQVADKSGGPL